jgi:Tol biopolymer transport system component/DNA-binding winged helix-turn-helix (wHTH) protein
MGSAEGKNGLIHFGPFELDPDAEQLRKRGVVLKLQPQQFVVLLMLAQRAGEIVTRQEIQQHVWGDGTFVDFDRAINYCINQIRSTLGDNAERPRYIETIPRRGYRFIAPVEARPFGRLPSREPASLPGTAAPAKPEITEQSANLGARRNPGFWPRVAVVAGFILLLGAALLHYGGWQTRRSPSSESRSLVRAGTGAVGQSAGSRVLAPAVMPLTSNPGNEIQPGFSPDGNQVVYAFNEGGEGPYHIYVKAVGSDQTVRLTSGPSDDMSPAWSPDGESIAFIRLGSEGGASVMIVSSSGGNVRKLASIAIDLLHMNDTRVSWSPDGDWIATSEVNSAGTSRLILISARTGQKKNLNYDPPKFDADVEPSFSPDGRYLVFARHISPPVADIFVLELPRDEGALVELRQLTNRNRRCGNPVWSADGQEILFIRGEAGAGSRIWRVAAFREEEARLVENVGEGSASIAFSPRSNRLAYSKGARDQNIWRMNLDSESSEPAPNHRESMVPLIASTRDDAQPQFSPDGRLIAFRSDRSGDPEIWIANSDGSGERQLTRLKAEISAGAHWSPNGKEIVFHSRPSGNANLYVVNVETGAYRQLTTGHTENYMPSWSHDGEWIYFGSGRDGTEQIWRMPAGGGSATRLTKNGGAMPLESPDGKQVFYTKTTEPGLWMLSLENGDESKILPSTAGFECFTMGKRGIYFERKAERSGFVISYMSLSDHVVRDVATIRAPVGDGLSVSPDERSILITQIDHAGSDLFLVENFK